jgi:hypothetical protein
MSVADLAATSQLMVKGMSFSSAASVVFSALLQAAREMGAAPERDGFEFSEMMEQFTGTEPSKKLAITNAITQAGAEFKIRAVNMPLAPALKRFNAGLKEQPARTPAMQRAEAHLRELAAKREATPDSWGAEDEAAFERAIAIAAGDVVPGEGGL